LNVNINDSNQGFNKPILISWLSYGGLSLLAPFSGLSVETIEYALRFRIFLIGVMGAFSVVFFSCGLLYLPLSTIMLIRVLANNFPFHGFIPISF
jgi:hypothetical protein